MPNWGLFDEALSAPESRRYARCIGRSHSAALDHHRGAFVSRELGCEILTGFTAARAQNRITRR